MKRFPLKLALLILTFFIGVGAVGLWYFSHLESEIQQSLSDAISSVTTVDVTDENPCDYPQPRHDRLSIKYAYLYGK